MHIETFRGLFYERIGEAEEKLGEFTLAAMMGDSDVAMLRLSEMYYVTGQAVGMLELFEATTPTAMQELQEYDAIVDFEDRMAGAIDAVNEGITIE